MTKIVKAWYKMSFWNAVLGVITPLTIGGEVAVYASGVNPVFHYVVIGAAILAAIIKAVIKDDDNDGVADLFEKK